MSLPRRQDYLRQSGAVQLANGSLLGAGLNRVPFKGVRIAAAFVLPGREEGLIDLQKCFFIIHKEVQYDEAITCCEIFNLYLLS